MSMLMLILMLMSQCEPALRVERANTKKEQYMGSQSF